MQESKLEPRKHVGTQALCYDKNLCESQLISVHDKVEAARPHKRPKKGKQKKVTRPTFDPNQPGLFDDGLAVSRVNLVHTGPAANPPKTTVTDVT